MDGEQEAVDLSMVVQAAADPADLQVPAVGDLPSHPAVLEEGGCAATVIDLARLQSPEGISACPGCGKEMRRSQLAIHMRKKDCESFSNQLPSIPFLAPVLGRVKCPSCEHVSPNLKALRKHYASLHGEKKSCAKCSKQYGRSDALRKHERTCGACSVYAAAGPREIRVRPALAFSRTSPSPLPGAQPACVSPLR
jgi:hypothetical protein